MESLMRKKEPRLLLGRQAVFHQGQVQVFIAAVQFVADNRMAEVREMNADLVFPAGVGGYTQERKWKIEDGGRIHLTPALSPAGGGEGEFPIVALSPVVTWLSAISRHRSDESAFDPELGPGRCAVGPDTILDRHAAVFVPAQGGIHHAVVIVHMPVDEGEVFLPHGAGFPKFAEFTGHAGGFGNEDDPAGLAVEAVDQMG